MKDVLVYDDKNQALEFAANQWISIAKEAIQNHGSFSAALSGGSTPYGIYDLLSERKDDLDWNKVFLFFSDERAVPLDHPDSNYRMAMEAGLDKLPIPSSHIFPMQGVGDLEANALAYEKQIRSYFKSHSRSGFDLMMLGMGDDGHTASLFPKTHALHAHGRLVVPNFIPEKNVWRLTVTFECINASEKTVVYVLGKNKASMIQKVFQGPQNIEELPIQGVGSDKNPALFILDKEAANPK